MGATAAPHTPGPWTVDEGEPVHVRADGSDKLVCEVGGQSSHRTEDDLPNARLIAAAPEMRELLKRWVRENRETLGQDCDCVHCETCRILDRAAGLCGSGSGDGYGDS